MALITFTKKIDRMLFCEATRLYKYKLLEMIFSKSWKRQKKCLCLKISMNMIAANLVLPTKGPTFTKYFNVNKRWIIFFCEVCFVVAILKTSLSTKSEAKEDHRCTWIPMAEYWAQGWEMYGNCSVLLRKEYFVIFFIFLDKRSNFP